MRLLVTFITEACGVAATELIVATTIGTTYYVRIYSTTAGPSPSGNGIFNICVRGVNTPIRFGNSYVNISKKATGGVVQTGDTLEIRMTINHKSTAGIIYSPRFVDNVPDKTTMLTGTGDRIRIITTKAYPIKNIPLVPMGMLAGLTKVLVERNTISVSTWAWENL
jgi:hypothetical protein